MADATEELAIKFAVSFTTELAKTTFKGLKGWLSTEANKHDLFGTALRAYKEGADQRHDSMRIFGMDRPVPLRDIYVRVNILERATARHHATIEELEQFFQRHQRGFGQSRETKDGIAAINELQKIIVLGKPGAGKTTFLKYLTLQALDGTLRENYLPIFVNLKEWSETQHTLLDFIVEQFDICGLPQADHFVRQNLVTGRCLLLLDGFDEVTNDVERAIREIRDFSDKYHQNHFVLSCRIAAFNYVFEHFTEVEMADFNDGQSQDLINKWFGKGSTKAALCWQKLTAPENVPIKELAATPLLLTMLCITFDEVMDFPPNRAELYKEAIDALLKKWDTSRSITRDTVYKQLSLKRKELMLSRIAFHAFQDGRYFFPQRYLEQQIAAYIRGLPDAQEETLEPDSEAILKAIAAQHGLFVERAKGIYSYSHLSFQEYFTAKYIEENSGRPTPQELLREHMLDDAWQEVWQLVVGLRPQADDIVMNMRTELARRLRSETARATLAEVSVTYGAVGDDNMPKPWGPILVAIQLAIHDTERMLAEAAPHTADTAPEAPFITGTVVGVRQARTAPTKQKPTWLTRADGAAAVTIAIALRTTPADELRRIHEYTKGTELLERSGLTLEGKN